MLRSMKQPVLLVLAAALLVLLGGNVWAFPDAEADPNAAAIEALRESGVIAGGPDGSFRPGAELTYAAGITMLVKAFDLNLDHMRFMKAPEASDYYEHVQDGKWYSESFIIASFYLDVPRDIEPDQPMTRQQYAHHLFRGIAAQGEFAYPEVYMVVEDEKKIDPAYKDSIQKLLVSRIVSLDENRLFEPAKTVKRGESAGWLHRALAFVREQLDRIDSELPEQPASPLTDVKLTVSALNEKVQEVTVSAQAPHPGYGIRVASVVFEGSQALIRVEPVEPDPDKMYAQVVTEVKATVYVGAEYDPILEADGGSSDVPAVR